MNARIAEIFVSIQGEGLYAGQKQVFVRFAGCDLSCAYCDEPASKSRGRAVALGDIKKQIMKTAMSSKARAVSFTGGEPLLQAEVLSELARYAKKIGLKTHLETNGVRHKELKAVADDFDVIAADLKLPSACGAAYWPEHLKFLRVSPQKTFIKAVVTSQTTVREITKAASLAASVGVGPFFIQPATLKGRVRPPAKDKIERFYKAASACVDDVRIMPQMHKLWGVK